MLVDNKQLKAGSQEPVCVDNQTTDSHKNEIDLMKKIHQRLKQQKNKQKNKQNLYRQWFFILIVDDRLKYNQKFTTENMFVHCYTKCNLN